MGVSWLGCYPLLRMCSRDSEVKPAAQSLAVDEGLDQPLKRSSNFCDCCPTGMAEILHLDFVPPYHRICGSMLRGRGGVLWGSGCHFRCGPVNQTMWPCEELRKAQADTPEARESLRHGSHFGSI